MASSPDAMHGQTTCAVDISPDVVEAGDELILRGKASCAPACDLRGHMLLVKDQAGADAGSVAFTAFNGETNETGELVVNAPVTPGEFAWVAVCPAFVKHGIAYPEASTPISFTVRAHATSVVAWDIPSAIVVGEKFSMKVGIKCSHQCDLTNREFRICDHEGALVVRGMLQTNYWPGTTGLHVVEVELEAPTTDGLYTWSVKVPSSDVGIPHAEASIIFGVRVVSHPEYLVTVETVDKVEQTPLRGARVVLHPYRAITDDRGIAEVRVAKGAYKLFVSQTRYITFGVPLEVTADVTTRAELDVEPVTERN
jgi:hypothetical protein